MKPDPAARPSEEIELKLALPTNQPSALAKQLSTIAPLARYTAARLHLHNVYFDTPGQILRQQRVALRLRRIGSDASPQWLQTLKIGDRGDLALSRRGEWEAGVPSAALAWPALKATPWKRIDPDGSVFGALAPCFVTSFERTRWRVRRRNGSMVEVALDVGKVVAGDHSAPICELELELLAGQPADLFDLARQIARSIPVLPLTMSKAERGYALAQGSLSLPLSAQPPLLTSELPLPEAARLVLGEMFSQFTTNLTTLLVSDDPEVVHQARVGWRRFRTAWRLFRPSLAAETVPSWQALRPLLTFLGELRDLDVARTETLPPLIDLYTAGDARRIATWQAMTQSLSDAAKLQRKAVQYALRKPAIGRTLLATTQWLEELPNPKGGEAPDSKHEPLSLRRWARQRLDHLHTQWARSLEHSDGPERQHRVRILAKRMRYGIEALKPLLTKHKAKTWYQQAVQLQTGLGTSRDMVQAGVLAARVGADPELVAFLRGVAVGQQRPA